MKRLKPQLAEIRYVSGVHVMPEYLNEPGTSTLRHYAQCTTERYRFVAKRMIQENIKIIKELARRIKII